MSKTILLSKKEWTQAVKKSLYHTLKQQSKKRIVQILTLGE